MDKDKLGIDFFFNACLRVLQDMRTKIYNKIIQTNWRRLKVPCFRVK